MLTVKVIGKQGEGKTTIVRALVDALVANGYGTIEEDELGLQSVHGGNNVKAIVRVVESQAPARKGKVQS